MSKLYWVNNNPKEVDEFGEPLEVYKRVAANWTIEKGGFPVKRVQPVCPSCAAHVPHTVTMVCTRFHFHERIHSQTRFRCDVMFKCPECSLVQTYGVALTAEQFETDDRPNKRGVYNRKRRPDK